MTPTDFSADALLAKTHDLPSPAFEAIEPFVYSQSGLAGLQNLLEGASNLVRFLGSLALADYLHCGQRIDAVDQLVSNHLASPGSTPGRAWNYVQQVACCVEKDRLFIRELPRLQEVRLQQAAEELIRTRNARAHGPVLSDLEADAALAPLVQSLSTLLDGIGFLAAYRLAARPVRTGAQLPTRNAALSFVGPLVVATQSQAELPPGTVCLLNQEGEWLGLSPLLILRDGAQGRSQRPRILHYDGSHRGQVRYFAFDHAETVSLPSEQTLGTLHVLGRSATAHGESARPRASSAGENGEDILTRLLRKLDDLGSHVRSIETQLRQVNAVAAIAPDLGLLRCAQVLEQILNNVHHDRLGEPETWQLGKILARLRKEEVIPEAVEKACWYVSGVGNLARHPTTENGTPRPAIEIGDVEAVLAALLRVIEWLSAQKALPPSAGH